MGNGVMNSVMTNEDSVTQAMSNTSMAVPRDLQSSPSQQGLSLSGGGTSETVSSLILPQQDNDYDFIEMAKELLPRLGPTQYPKSMVITYMFSHLGGTLAHKLLDIFIYTVYADITAQRYFVPFSYIKSKLNRSGDNYRDFWAAIDALANEPFVFTHNSPADAEHFKVFNYSFLGGYHAHRRDGEFGVAFEVPFAIKQALYQPDVTPISDLVYLRDADGKYDVRLMPFFLYLYESGMDDWIEFDEFRKVLFMRDESAISRGSWGRVRADVLDPQLKALNSNESFPFYVTYEAGCYDKKHSRKVTHIKFMVEPQEAKLNKIKKSLITNLIEFFEFTESEASALIDEDGVGHVKWVYEEAKAGLDRKIAKRERIAMPRKFFEGTYNNLKGKRPSKFHKTEYIEQVQSSEVADDIPSKPEKKKPDNSEIKRIEKAMPEAAAFYDDLVASNNHVQYEKVCQNFINKFLAKHPSRDFIARMFNDFGVVDKDVLQAWTRFYLADIKE